MIKFTVEMEANDVVEIMKGGANLFNEFEKQFKENEAWIRNVREKVVGADRVDESFEEIQERLEKQIAFDRDVVESKIREEVKEELLSEAELKELKNIKFEDLCTHKSNNGTTALKETSDGVVCELCNKRFKLTSEDNNENKKAIVHVNNMIETIKACNLEISEGEILELAKLQSILNTLDSKLTTASGILDKHVSKITLQPMIDPNHPLATNINHIQSFSLLPHNRLW